LKFPLAALYLVIFGFVFLIMFGIGSLLLSSMDDALSPTSPDSQFDYQVDIIIAAFGVIGAIVLVTGVIVFVVESLSDEPEYYYRR